MPDLPPLVARVVADITGFKARMSEAREELGKTGASGNSFSSALKGHLQSLTGPSTTAGKALKAVGVDASSMGSTLGTAVAGGAAVAGIALAGFALKGVKAFAETTAEVRQFQRVSGATAEDSSKLVAAARQLGIGADTTAAAMFKLSKNVATHSDTLKADGVQIAVNRQGHVDLIGTLFSVSDAYKRTEDQVQKNKIVFDAFGKAGAAMIPILQRGRDGLKELFAEAQKHHEIFSDADLEKGRQFTLASRELGTAVKGIEIEVGSRLVPALTDLAHTATGAIEGFDSLAHGLGDLGPVGDVATAAFSNLKAQVNPVGTAVALAHGDFRRFGEGLPLVGTALDLFGHHTDSAAEKTKKAAAEAEDAANTQALAVGILSTAQQSGAQAALQHLVANGRLTQGQLEQNVAMHQAKDGTSDFAATLKDLDPTMAKNVEAQARLDAGLGDLRDGFAHAAEAADTLKTALDASLGIFISEQEASIRQAQAQDALSTALNKTATSQEEVKQKAQDVRQATIDLVQADETLIEAQVRDSNGAINSAQAKDLLIARLRDEEARYPGLKAQIEDYIGHIQAIPPEKLTNTGLPNAGQAINDADNLANHIRGIPGVWTTQILIDIGQAYAQLRTLAQQIEFVDRLFAGARGAVNFSARPGEPGFLGSAEGGIFDKPTLTWVAEKGHREVIIPLDDRRRAEELTVRSGLAAMLSGSSGGASAPVGSISPALVVGSTGGGGGGDTYIVSIYAQPGEDAAALWRRLRAEMEKDRRNNRGRSLSV